MSELPEDLSAPSVVNMSNAPEWQEVPADVKEKANKLQSLIAADIAQQKFFLAAIRAEAHRAGMLAGLKEAAGIAIDQAKAADEMLNAARDERDRVGGLVHSAEAAEGRLIAKSIRARIAEIEGEKK